MSGMGINLRNCHMGVLERTVWSSERCYHYDCGCYKYIEAGTEFACQCRVHFLEDALTPQPVINVIHYKLSGLHHDIGSQSLQEQPVLCCEFYGAKTALHSVKLFPASR